MTTLNQTYECPVCDSTDIVRSVDEIDGDLVGLANMHLSGVIVVCCHECGETTYELPPQKLVSASIARELAQSNTKVTSPGLSILRHHIGLTGLELAKTIGVSNVSLSRWESGRVKVPKHVAILMKSLVLLPRYLRARVLANAQGDENPTLSLNLTRLKDNEKKWHNERSIYYGVFPADYIIREASTSTDNQSTKHINTLSVHESTGANDSDYEWAEARRA